MHKTAKKVLIGMTAAAVCLTLAGCGGKANTNSESATMRSLNAELNALQKTVEGVNSLDETNLMFSDSVSGYSEQSGNYRMTANFENQDNSYTDNHSARYNLNRRTDHILKKLNQQTGMQNRLAEKSGINTHNVINEETNERIGIQPSNEASWRNHKRRSFRPNRRNVRSHITNQNNTNQEGFNNYVERLGGVYERGNELRTSKQDFLDQKLNLARSIAETKSLISGYERKEMHLAKGDTEALKEYIKVLHETRGALKAHTPAYNRELKASKKYNLKNVALTHARYLRLKTQTDKTNDMVDTAQMAVEEINAILKGQGTNSGSSTQNDAYSLNINNQYKKNKAGFKKYIQKEENGFAGQLLNNKEQNQTNDLLFLNGNKDANTRDVNLLGGQNQHTRSGYTTLPYYMTQSQTNTDPLNNSGALNGVTTPLGTNNPLGANVLNNPLGTNGVNVLNNPLGANHTVNGLNARNSGINNTTPYGMGANGATTPNTLGTTNDTVNNNGSLSRFIYRRANYVNPNTTPNHVGQKNINNNTLNNAAITGQNQTTENTASGNTGTELQNAAQTPVTKQTTC